jgi:cysteine desulfurase
MRIYLDHNATTPLRPAVAEAMSRALRDLFGNPSSAHAEGARARAAVEEAREQVAALVGARPREVVFTSGATEANHLAIHGTAAAAGAPPGLVATAVEHPSVAEPISALAAAGRPLARVPVDGDGRLDLAALDSALARPTALCACVWAQHETGVISPVPAVSDRCRERGVPLLVDATQALGRVPVDLARVSIDLLSGSAHKLGGPKGVGFLVVRGERALVPWLRGGSQERGRRAGTVNAPAVVGFGVAAALAAAEGAARASRLSALRDRLWEGIASKVPRVRRNGAPEALLPNTLHVEFEGIAADVLVEALDGEGVAASAGAACASGAAGPSPALLAMGRSAEQARAGVRFSLGAGNDEAQIDRVVALLPDLVARVRAAAGAGAR